MKTSALLLCLTLLQSVFAQKRDKIDRLDFCGWRLETQQKIREGFGDDYRFLRPQSGDTIVDIGAASGAYQGALAAGFGMDGVHFVLVDIDGRCLNGEKLSNMLRHYAAVKGDSIRTSFELVKNTPDSLYLPLNRYRKVWLINTLHEVGSPEKMARDIGAVLQSGGEVCVLEKPARREGELHGGCKLPLLLPEQLEGLFTKNGFRLVEKETLYYKKKLVKAVLYRFVKE